MPAYHSEKGEHQTSTGVQGAGDFSVYAKDPGWAANSDPAKSLEDFARGALQDKFDYYRGGQRVTPNWANSDYEGPAGNRTAIQDMLVDGEFVMPEGFTPEALGGAMLSQLGNEQASPFAKAAAYAVGQQDALFKLGLAYTPGHGALAATGVSTALRPVKATGVANQMKQMGTAASKGMPTAVPTKVAPPSL